MCLVWIGKLVCVATLLREEVFDGFLLSSSLPEEYMMCKCFEGFIDSLIPIVTRIDPSVIARLALPHDFLFPKSLAHFKQINRGGTRWSYRSPFTLTGFDPLVIVKVLL